MKIKRTESMIQRAILDYLETVDNIYFFRAGSGAFQTAQGRYVKTGRPGVPDIVACINGKFIGLEVKTETGSQSKAQKEAEINIAKSGGKYFIVRSVQDVKNIIGGIKK